MESLGRVWAAFSAKYNRGSSGRGRCRGVTDGPEDRNEKEASILVWRIIKEEAWSKQAFDHQGNIPNGPAHLPTACSKLSRPTKRLTKHMTSTPPATKAPSTTPKTHPGKCQLAQRPLR